MSSSLLSEEAFWSVIDDVWALLSPLNSPQESAREAVAGAVSTGKKKRRRDRNRPWHEISRLQTEAAELERQVQERSVKATKKMRLSLQTYVTNARLKTILRESFTATRALEQNLNSQMDELVQAMPHPLVTTRNLPYHKIQDEEVYVTMARSVDDQYRDMEQALHLAKLDKGNSEITDAVICNTADSLKSRVRIKLPFKHDCLVEALWTYIERCEDATLRSRNLDLPLVFSSRVAIQKYEVALGDYVCIMRMVVKKFVEKNRTVHVWAVVSDWSIAGMAHNVKTCESGWGFIQPINDKDSVCLSYSLVNPTMDGSTSGNCDAMKNLIKLYHRFMIFRMQKLENQTLDKLIQDEKDTHRKMDE